MTVATPRAVVFDFGGVTGSVRWDITPELEAGDAPPRGAAGVDVR